MVEPELSEMPSLVDALKGRMSREMKDGAENAMVREMANRVAMMEKPTMFDTRNGDCSRGVAFWSVE